MRVRKEWQGRGEGGGKTAEKWETVFFFHAQCAWGGTVGGRNWPSRRPSNPDKDVIARMCGYSTRHLTDGYNLLNKMKTKVIMTYDKYKIIVFDGSSQRAIMFVFFYEIVGEKIIVVYEVHIHK